MLREIVTDVLFLMQKSTTATKADLPTAQDLLDTLKANSHRCVGMAANMIGVTKRIIAINASSDNDKSCLNGLDDKYIVMLNPKIIDHSKQTYEAQEGCLSLTGERTAARYVTIVVEYQDKRLKRKKQTFSGFTAQIIQHELDHFDGILI